MVLTALARVIPIIVFLDLYMTRAYLFLTSSQSLGALGKKARDGTISIDDMAGGTFTISNGGVYGSMMSTPIINPPQSAILGMHAINQVQDMGSRGRVGAVDCNLLG